MVTCFTPIVWLETWKLLTYCVVAVWGISHRIEHGNDDDEQAKAAGVKKLHHKTLATFLPKYKCEKNYVRKTDKNANAALGCKH